MKLKYLFSIILSVTILLFIGGCAKEEPFIKEGPTKHYYWKTPVEWCEQNASASEKDSCFLKSALDFDEPSTCERIKTQSGDVSKDVCYIKLSKKLNNLKLCENVIKDVGINSKDQCLQEIAILRNDNSICESMKLESQYTISTGSKDLYHFSKDVCFFSVAFNTNNLELCENISDDATGFGQNPYAYNELMRWGSKKACKTWIAAKTNDISICRDIQADHFIDTESCIISVAVWNNEPSFCESIEGKRLAFADYLKQHSKNECYYKVGLTYHDLDTCNKMTDESTPLILESKHGPIYEKKSCVRSVEESLKLGSQKGQRDQSTTPNQMW